MSKQRKNKAVQSFRIKEATKKITVFFSGPATKRGRGVKGLATKKKYSFLKL